VNPLTCLLIAGYFLNDVYVFAAPAAVPWASIATFIDVYDWDTVVIASSSPVAALSFQVDLCVGFFPCTLTVAGEDNTIQRLGSSLISCDAALGCTGLILSSLKVECAGGPAAGPVVRVAGGAVSVINSTFANCSSSSDGSAIQSFAGSVQIVDSDFISLRSEGAGGAISAVGGTVVAQRSLFRRCTAGAKGGAISAAAFQCSGEASVTTTEVEPSFSCTSHAVTCVNVLAQEDFFIYICVVFVLYMPGSLGEHLFFLPSRIVITAANHSYLPPSTHPP
jgi:hypothetical protein